MIASDLIVVAFKVINFAALIGLCLYFFQRKLKKKIKTKIEEKEVFWQNLQTNKKVLIDQQHKLSIEITWQQQYAQELLKKIGIWRSTSLEFEQALQNAMLVNAQQAYERTLAIKEHKQLLATLDQIVPKAMDDVHKELVHYFSELKNADRYVENVVVFMKKSI